MKKAFLILSIIAISGNLFAQNCNAIFFNQNGEKFQVVLNGILQDNDYLTNVKITGLKFEGSYKVSIIFENQLIPKLNKSIYLMDNNTEYTFIIKKNKKQNYVLRTMSFVSIDQATPIPSQSIITYTTIAPTPHISTTTTTTSTTVNSSNVNNQENVAIGMNVNGVAMNVNVNVNDGGMNTDVNSSTSTSYSETTTTSTTYSSGMNTEPVGNTVFIENHYVMNGYNGPVGCPYPMSDTDFSAAKKSISSKSFSDSRLTIAKQITRNNCLTSEQAKQLTKLFDFESVRLEYAKFAYEHTFDLGNYYKINDAFDFESTIEELNSYIESK